MVYEEDKDNDSAYFVKITVNSQFLAHMDDPRIVEVQELKGKFNILIENPVFIDIVRREVELNLGVHQKKIEIDKAHRTSCSQTEEIEEEESAENYATPSAVPDSSISSSIKSASLENTDTHSSQPSSQSNNLKKDLADYSQVLHHQIIHGDPASVTEAEQEDSPPVEQRR